MPSVRRRLLPPALVGLAGLVAQVALLAPGATAPTVAEPAPARASGSPAAARAVPGTRVLAISVDGLNPRALDQLGPEGAPAFQRLLAEGASTLDARTQVEQTVTLPNHTSMLTGRRITAARGGHGVTWNTDRPGATVQRAAGGPVSSIFTTVHDGGGSSALFASKAKFGLFKRSWRTGVDRFVADEKVPRLVRTTRADLVSTERDFTFLHLSLPDVAGHAHGFMSAPYVAAVARTDRLIGTVLATIDATPALREHLVVVLTSDHGGIGAGHADARLLQDFRVPFVVWGAGIAPADLYAINPAYRSPGTTRPGYGGVQPIRNGMVADLSASLLGLPSVPGSTQDADQSLRVTAG